MFEDVDQESKTEPATAQKREDARKKGMIAHSADLTHAVSLMAGFYALTSLGSWLFRSIHALTAEWLGHLDGHTPILDVLAKMATPTFFSMLTAFGALMGVIALSVMILEVAQAGLHFNLDLLVPKFDRFNPIQGFSRIFSMNSLAMTIFGLFKITVIFWATYKVVVRVVEMAPMWWRLPIGSLLPTSSEYILDICWRAGIAMLVLALADWGYQKWRYERDLRMTKEEVKEENKQHEGNPEIRGRIRQVQRTMALKRMMKNVPKASVVITNPTHVAVAILYEPGQPCAPIVIAKGEHRIAERIKAIAAQHEIPIIEEPPLARALLRSVQIGQEIPVEFYRAVAEILAVLYRRRAPAPLPAMKPVPLPPVGAEAQ